MSPRVVTTAGTQRVQADIGELLFPADDHVIAPIVSRLGVWEPEEADFLRAHLPARGGRVLDVGANVGYFCVLLGAGRSDVNVVAVEPHPLLLPLLELNCWRHRVDATILPMAFGNERGFASLASAPNNPGDSRLSTGDGYVVPLSRGDDEVSGGFHLIKIDVQGWELDVVGGLERTIRSSRSPVVVAEFWPAAIRERGLQPIDVLGAYERLGFTLAVLAESGLEAVRSKLAVVDRCDLSGPDGAVNLVLTRP